MRKKKRVLFYVEPFKKGRSHTGAPQKLDQLETDLSMLHEYLDPLRTARKPRNSWQNWAKSKENSKSRNRCGRRTDSELNIKQTSTSLAASIIVKLTG